MIESGSLPNFNPKTVNISEKPPPPEGSRMFIVLSYSSARRSQLLFLTYYCFWLVNRNTINVEAVEHFSARHIETNHRNSVCATVQVLPVANLHTGNSSGLHQLDFLLDSSVKPYSQCSERVGGGRRADVYVGTRADAPAIFLSFTRGQPPASCIVNWHTGKKIVRPPACPARRLYCELALFAQNAVCFSYSISKTALRKTAGAGR